MFECVNGSYYPCEHNVVKHITKGVYNVKMNQRYYRVEACYTGDNFKIPSKIYSLDSIFLNRVINTFKRRGTNLGVLLNGYKGSGKTVLAKIICNKIDVPVFLINEKIDCNNIQIFINALDQDSIIFIDEYEKIYGQDDELLNLMDGSFNIKHKILFLFTSNNMTINENLFNRPSRIQYMKQFGGLSETDVDEILSEGLKNKLILGDVKNLVLNFEQVTIDNLLILLDEINYNEDISLEEIIKNLNINFKTHRSNFTIKKL